MGSEMCIRDRAHCPCGDRLQPSLNLVSVEVTVEEERIQFLLVGPCLLYTSDAADERSSVDLGGRRIIKKKKSDADQHCRLSNEST